MYFKLNYNDKINRPKLFLRIPNEDGHGELKTGNKLNFELNANDISVMNFNIYKKLDGKDVEYYDLVTEGNLVEAQLLGVYWIIDVEEHGTGVNAYKEITAKSLEYELKRRKIFDISGVLSLYNVAETDKSLMHIICSYLGNWSIGHIDDSLKTLYRTFDIESSDVYSLLTDSISTSFKCIFNFDTHNRVINAYTIDNFGKNTNIFLSYRNLVQENVITSSLENITTCYRVRGGDNLDIRAVSPTLDDKIYNFDWFMVPKSQGGKATDGLVTAWNTYKVKYASLSATQTNNVSLLKTYNTQLLELKNKVPSSPTTDWTQYGLTELESQEKTYTDLQSVLLSNGAGSKNSPQYAEYTSTRNTLLAVQSEITVRENQISAKEAQITALNNTISSIADQLATPNNFTAEQIKELRNFTFEDEYVDETYVVGEEDSEETALEIKQQLYNVADEALTIASQPQFSLETTLANLFMLPEFKGYQDDFELGNIIKVKVTKDNIAIARLLSIKIDFEKIDDLTVVFSNRNKLDSNSIDFAKTQAQANQTSNTVKVSGISWDKAADQTNVIQQYMNNALNAATQEIVNSDNQEVTYGSYGLRLREKDITTGTYLPEEMWLVKNKIVLSDDNFESARMCIGKYLADDGHYYYGVNGETVVANLILSSALKIYNKSGTYSITDDNGLQAVNGIYSVGINPSLPSEIINVKVNGSKVLYVDTTTNNLVFSGLISAANFIGGSISSSNYVSGNTGMYINLTYGTIDSKNFKVTSTGEVTMTQSNFSGKITASSIDIGGGDFTVTSSGALTAKNATIKGNISGSTIDGSIISGSAFTSFGYDNLGTPMKTHIENGVTTTNVIYVRPINGITEDFSDDSAGYVFMNATQIGIIGRNESTSSFLASSSGDVRLSTINGDIPLTDDNFDNYAVALTDYHTNQIEPDLTSSENIGFKGKNAASVTWVDDNFQRISSSDMRLKKNILALDFPEELFMLFKPKQYEFKCSNYPETKVFGFLAQEVESAFQSFNINPYEYNLIDKMNVRTYTDEGLYVDDYIHRINYENFHAVEVLMIQKLYARVQELEQKINNM